MGETTGGEVSARLVGADCAEVVAVDRPEAFADIAGSEVVVLVEGVDVAAAARAVARRAPGAVLLVATSDAERDTATALEAGLMPRPRAFGVVAQDVATAVEAVIFGRDTPLQAAALCRGELGIEDRVATVPVRVGTGGLRAVG